MSSHRLKIAITILVVAAGAGFLVYSSLADAEYYKMVNELMVEPDDWTGKSMRIHGFVEPGSIDERIVDQSTKRTFVLEREGKRILVRHEGPVPDAFRETAEIVARGRLVKEGKEYVFIARELTATCPSKYESTPTRGGASGGGGRPLF
jgi:cytochrome c-type biogenesis protein CcmE